MLNWLVNIYFCKMTQMIDTHSLEDLLSWTLLSLDSHLINYFVSAITPFFNFQLDPTARIMQALIYFYDIRSKYERQDFETITSLLSSEAWIISQQLHSSLMNLIGTCHFKQQMSKIISNNQNTFALDTDDQIKIEQQVQPFYESIHMQTDQFTPKGENIIEVQLFNQLNNQLKTQEDEQSNKNNPQQEWTSEIFCFCEDSKRAIAKNRKYYTCKQCQCKYHRICMKSNSICPYCQLINQNPTEKVQCCVVLIYQPKQIIMSQSLFYVGSLKRNQRLQCRIVHIDRFGNNKSQFPQNFSLIINDKQIYSHDNIHQEIKTKLEYIEIPRQAINSHKHNRIIINTQSISYNLLQQKKNTQNYLIGLFITQKDYIVNPIKEIISYNYFPANESLLLQKQYLQNDDLYYTLEYSTFKFSAICPSRKQAMVIPARGKNCLHYSCFDLVFFMEVSGKKPRNNWRCPICNESASEIQVDSLIQSLILPKFNSHVIGEIRFLSNGYYTLIDRSGNQIEKKNISDIKILDRMAVIDKVHEIVHSYEQIQFYPH